MKQFAEPPSKLGVMIIGLGGAVATTAVAGVELLKIKEIGADGLPLSQAPAELTEDLIAYENLVFGGWDLCADDLAQAAATHNVLTVRQYKAVENVLGQIKPLPAVGNKDFCQNIECRHTVVADGFREMIEILRGDMQNFKRENDCESVVVVNLASTEKYFDKTASAFSSLKNFEQALDSDAPEIAPAMIYAYAAIAEGAGYANFTPSVAADVPALVEFAVKQNAPVAGKDGKTGQTMMKTAVAPALKTRALKVEGWYSTNILGNRDGLALSDPESLKSKVTTKGSVLDEILGYKVEDHLVDIRYYKPRGDNKEAWDNIDVTGFLGQPMQIKINFLCRDSILAAPLVIDIARVLELAQRRGMGGVQEQLSVFFKLPQTADPAAQPVHALHEQEQMLFRWLENKQENKIGKTESQANGNGHRAANGNAAAEQIFAERVQSASGDAPKN